MAGQPPGVPVSGELPASRTAQRPIPVLRRPGKRAQAGRLRHGRCHRGVRELPAQAGGSPQPGRGRALPRNPPRRIARPARICAHPGHTAQVVLPQPRRRLAGGRHLERVGIGGPGHRIGPGRADRVGPAPAPGLAGLQANLRKGGAPGHPTRRQRCAHAEHGTPGPASSGPCNSR